LKKYETIFKKHKNNAGKFKKPAFEYKILLKSRRDVKIDGMSKCCAIALGVFRETILYLGGTHYDEWYSKMV